MSETSAENQNSDVPQNLEQAGDEHLRIEWKSGHESEYHVFYLRYHCPCAHCVDEVTGERRIDAGSIPEDIKPVHLESVGNYAIRIEWEDGHDTGIYSFDLLRDLCPCEDCENVSVSGPEDIPDE